MYIAAKWLISLAFLMWLAMFLMDSLYLKQIKRNKVHLLDEYAQIQKFENNSKSAQHNAILKRNKQFRFMRHHEVTSLHLMMFFAGAFAVSVLNKKKEIVFFAKSRIVNADNINYLKTHLNKFKTTAITFGVAIAKIVTYYWEILKVYVISLEYHKSTTHKKLSRGHAIYTMIINRMKQLGEERKNLGHLLIAAIHENKNIRMKYQLEMMAKNRLVQHIESTQQIMKENRSKYVSFQQLYLVTHQENSLLKSKLIKLTNEKTEAEKSLMTLMNEIFSSRNINQLKADCSKFLIRSKESFAEWDAKAEIEKFYRRTGQGPSNSNHGRKTLPNVYPSNNSKRSLSRNTRITEILQDDCLIPTINDAPKLKGLPGECVWTVKDKNGLIEKLYEYDYASEFDDRDTMRRIRQYSVYYDKDCFLDLSNALPRIDEEAEYGGIKLSSNKLVTGSEAFQNFLQLNNSILPGRK